MPSRMPAIAATIVIHDARSTSARVSRRGIWISDVADKKAPLYLNFDCIVLWLDIGCKDVRGFIRQRPIRGRLLKSATCFAALLVFSTVMQSAAFIDESKLDAEVKKITDSAILIDTHNDIPSFTVDGADIGKSPKNHTDIPRLRAGGV